MTVRLKEANMAKANDAGVSRRSDQEQRFLGIYLNDQFALGVAGRELARRAARENVGSETGSALANVAREIAEDLAIFESLMARLGVKRSRVKPYLGALAERAGRLKLNGTVRTYSPLSRFSELDLLVMGLDAKKALWAALRDFAAVSQVAGVDFDDLIARAQAQRDTLEPLRARAGRAAFGARDQGVASPA
jgi:hypothetical protein